MHRARIAGVARGVGARDARWKVGRHMRAVLMAAAVAAAHCAGLRAAPHETVLAAFTDMPNGAEPTGLLYHGGALFGATFEGGAFYDGVVFRLAPPKTGSRWTLTLLHQFSGGSDGGNPNSSLIADKAGALYGTTSIGGGGDCIEGCGVVFRLAPPAKGQTRWAYSVLHQFQGHADGLDPIAPLAFDAKGNLYGSAFSGGAATSDGTAFRLTPPASGKGPWRHLGLHHFNGATEGSGPESAFAIDAQGALYGATVSNGPNNGGTIFKLAPPAGGVGAWPLTVLWAFGAPNDGDLPIGNILRTRSGAIYGATFSGGIHNRGLAFVLVPAGTGFNEVQLYSFGATPGDAVFPSSGLLLGAQGEVYGASQEGGGLNFGTIYKLSAPPGGATPWNITLLHNFMALGDGSTPVAPVIFDPAGPAPKTTLYGTTDSGGQNKDCVEFVDPGCGVVFRITQ